MRTGAKTIGLCELHIGRAVEHKHGLQRESAPGSPQMVGSELFGFIA